MNMHLCIYGGFCFSSSSYLAGIAGVNKFHTLIGMKYANIPY